MVNVQFIVEQQEPAQITTQPAQNTELTQHEPVKNDLFTAIIWAVAIIIIYWNVKDWGK